MVVAQSGPVRGIDFPATLPAATAPRAARVEGYVSELSCHAVQPASKQPVDKDSHPHAF